MIEFEEIKRVLRTADHMVYVTYPVLKESRLLIKVLESIHFSVDKAVELVMKHEYKSKRIQLYADSRLNMTVFEQRCAPRCNLTADELTGIRQISDLYNSHKTSPVEFVRQNKFIIMSDDLKTESLTLPKVKSLLGVAKEVVRKAEIYVSKEKIADFSISTV